MKTQIYTVINKESTIADEAERKIADSQDFLLLRCVCVCVFITALKWETNSPEQRLDSSVDQF